MAFKFEELIVWQRSLQLTVEINDLCMYFPMHERYNLSNQIRRAADSVVLNIAEGCTGQTTPEFRKFLGYSLRSSIEVVSCLFIAKNKRYLSEEVFFRYYKEYENLCRMLTKLKNSLQ
jgi:four helix bundle protein